MAKMSKVQRRAMLDSSRPPAQQIIANWRTVAVLVREGWARYPGGVSESRARRDRVQVAYPTRAGLIEAGLDMDALHAEALEGDNGQRVAREGAIVQRRGEVGPRYPLGRVRSVARGSHGPVVNVSFNGLAGLWADPSFFVPIDRDAAHAEALDMDDARYIAEGEKLLADRMAPTTAEERDAHSSAYWERATDGMERRPAFTTPAESSADVSGRTAAALADVAELRRYVETANPAASGPLGFRLDRIETALRLTQ